jgi:hypothetical protein
MLDPETVSWRKTTSVRPTPSQPWVPASGKRSRRGIAVGGGDEAAGVIPGAADGAAEGAAAGGSLGAAVGLGRGMDVTDGTAVVGAGAAELGGGVT